MTDDLIAGTEGPACEAEWLEADGLGGFASGTVSGIRTRRYHAVLLAATTPPTGRVVLVNGVEVWAVMPRGRVALSSHLYQPGVRHPDGASRLVAFTTEPWPMWTWDIGDGARIVGELFATHGAPRVVMTWRVEDATGPVTLEVRPLMSGRDYHALHHENGAFRHEPEQQGAAFTWHTYDGMPAVTCLTNGEYAHRPEWFRQFLYSAEQERGLDDTEDLASPGVIRFDLLDSSELLNLPAEAGSYAEKESYVEKGSHTTSLVASGFSRKEAICIWQTLPADPHDPASVGLLAQTLKMAERTRRAGFVSSLARAADQYIVRRGEGRTIVAGYPWFTDWGRDTFIALRGLCLTLGRFQDARDILLEWSGAVSEGMLPNRFPDAGGEPEYNAVDASLWFVIAVHELLEAARERPQLVTRPQRTALQEAIAAILEGYSRGTRYGIGMDDDGLLAAGEPGQQLTWMDARVDGREITPRIGKPVEIQALWLNALHAASAFDARWCDRFDAGLASFSERFWTPDRRALFDVVDVDHRHGVCDATLRPNQVLALGGLPLPLVTGARARAIVDTVERELWTPVGLRSLARVDPAYVSRYSGNSAARDGAYHQGTSWPWLIGPFVDAWLRVRDYGDEARRMAQTRFLAPIQAHLNEAGLGHVSEIADAELPFVPRGCPFQAWSLGELIRAHRMVAIPERAAERIV